MNVKTGIFVGAMFLSAIAGAQAQLAWEQKEIELHPKAGDAEAVANFKYQNKGDKPIKINSVKSSCGCTVASLKKDTVAPGEKGEVTATFKIGGRTGVQQKSVTVETDDASQPITTLILKAVISPAVEIQPTFVFWENGEAPNAKTIKVKAAKDVNLTKLEAISSNPDFATKVEKGSGPGEFTVSVQPKDTLQTSNAMLTLKSDLPEMYYVTLRVIGSPGAGH